MSRLAVLPIDFMGQGALLEPVDRKLHDMAVDYCARELQGGENLDLTRFAKVWVTVSIEDDKYIEIFGITGYVLRPDLPVFRVTGDKPDRVTQMMADRLHAYFQDQGCRGQELFLHISSKETPEQRCGKWEESLKIQGATPADRFLVKI